MSQRRPKTFRLTPGRRRATYRPRVEVVESRILLAVFSVTSATDNGLGTNPGSLSWAITQVNSDPKPGVDTIDFKIPGTGTLTISPASTLPSLNHPAFIDGGSQPGYSDAPIIEILGPGNNSSEDGLTLAAGSDGSTVTGLCISGFGGGAGIRIESQGNLVSSNYLGTDSTGTTSQPNQTGVWIDNAANNTIGGTVSSASNVISSNTMAGVLIEGPSATGNLVAGNFLGSDRSGSRAIGLDTTGLAVKPDDLLIMGRASYNTIGGFAQGAGNIIVGNGISGKPFATGVAIDGASHNTVAANYIGTDKSGANALGLLFAGISVGDGSADNTIGAPNVLDAQGGIQTLYGNVVSANTEDGIDIEGPATNGNRILGNLVGSNASGTTALGNLNAGLAISNGARNNTVGGLESGAANLISANNRRGIEISGVSTDDNVVAGNLIGTDIFGTHELGNGDGILISAGAGSNTIGGSLEGARNLISGNSDSGVTIQGGSTSQNIVAGNFVGTTARGDAVLPNLVGLQIGGNGNIVGVGTVNGGVSTTGKGNLISGNLSQGVSVIGSSSGLDFGKGFDSAGGSLTLNGSATIGQGLLQLTDGGFGETSSAFSNNTINITDFTNTFEFQITPGTEPAADGLTFTIQGVGPTAIGYTGGGLGYGSDSPSGRLGIGQSVAIKFDLYDNQGEGTDSTGIYTNGASPTVPAIDLSSTNPKTDIDLHSGDVFDVAMSYDGATLNVTITDKNTSASASHSYPVDIPLLVGGNSAYVGFTAGTGGLSAVQQVLSWQFETSGSGPAVTSTSNSIAGNLIGTNALGTSSLGNGAGVVISGGAHANTIGGSFVGAGNVISGNNGDGVRLNDADTSQNVVAGNLIGTDLNGSKVVGNGNHGVDISGGEGTTIGGPVAGAGNVIAGNGGFGVQIIGTSTPTSNNVVAGNYIGTNRDGSSNLGNLLSGVFIKNSSGNTVGGINTSTSNDTTTSLIGNVIADNGFDGLDIVGSLPDGSSATANVVAGNFIGTNPGFSAELGNQNAGVRLFQTNQNTIGGAVVGGGNTIAGNGSNGISALTSNENKIYGNQIGIGFRRTGTGAKLVEQDFSLPNVGDGIQLIGSGNNVIGLDPGDDLSSDLAQGKVNVISGNDGLGIDIGGGTSAAGSNTVRGNWIGTDLAGRSPLGNGGGGIQIASSPANSLTGNVIAANDGIGISLANADESLVQDNLLGTDVSGTLNNALANGDIGIRVLNSSGNSVSAVVISGNVLGWCQGAGIAVTGSKYIQISNNKIGTDGTGERSGFIGSDGIRVVNSYDLSILGNVVSTCNGDGISATNSRLVIQGNKIGTDLTGTEAGVLYNQGDGIDIVFSAVTIGGVVSADSNVVSNNISVGISISVASMALIQGNKIGTDITGRLGTDSKGNRLSNFSDGISVFSLSDATIGGVVSADSNVISNNYGDGISIATGASALIQGNEIGTDITGSYQLSNKGDGIGVLNLNVFDTGPLCTIGGTAREAANVISGNVGTGISVTGSESIRILGNYIGTSGTGESPLPNGGDGIRLENSRADSIGPGNVISGNLTYGVHILGNQSVENLLVGNLIGTDLSGQFDVANGLDGVLIEQQASSNTVGQSNVMSGNKDSGVHLTGAGTASNVIAGNLIGASLGGARLQERNENVQPIGVLIDQGATGSIIRGNVISGNSFAGVVISGTAAPSKASASRIIGNLIGTDASGTVAVSNEIGVLVDNSATNAIGGTDPGTGNTISGNTQFGVEIIGTSATANQVMGNLIGPGARETAFANSGQDVARWYLAQAPWLQQEGVLVTGSIGNTVGGSTSGARNVISGNDVGVEISGFNSSLQSSNTVAGSSSVIMGNSIGITPGETTVGNVCGVWVNDVPDNRIGGSGAGAVNIISGNSQTGVYIIGQNADGNLVQGNMIGLGPDGQTYNQGTGKDPTYPFPIGVYIQDSSSNTIGGTSAGARNWISGNNVGVYIFGTGGSSTNNQILGNSIGLSDKGGSTPGNVLYGVMLYNAPNNNAPRTGRSRNQFAGNGIADFREFSGTVPRTKASSTGKGSGSKVKKPAHHSNHVAQQSPRRTTLHAAVTVDGRPVPAGPIRKRRARVSE